MAWPPSENAQAAKDDAATTPTHMWAMEEMEGCSGEEPQRCGSGRA